MRPPTRPTRLGLVATAAACLTACMAEEPPSEGPRKGRLTVKVTERGGCGAVGEVRYRLVGDEIQSGVVPPDGQLVITYTALTRGTRHLHLESPCHLPWSRAIERRGVHLVIEATLEPDTTCARWITVLDARGRPVSGLALGNTQTDDRGVAHPGGGSLRIEHVGHAPHDVAPDARGCVRLAPAPTLQLTAEGGPAAVTAFDEKCNEINTIRLESRQTRSLTLPAAPTHLVVEGGTTASPVHLEPGQHAQQVIAAHRWRSFAVRAGGLPAAGVPFRRSGACHTHRTTDAAGTLTWGFAEAPELADPDWRLVQVEGDTIEIEYTGSAPRLLVLLVDARAADPAAVEARLDEQIDDIRAACCGLPDAHCEPGEPRALLTVVQSSDDRRHDAHLRCPDEAPLLAEEVTFDLRTLTERAVGRVRAARLQDSKYVLDVRLLAAQPPTPPEVQRLRTALGFTARDRWTHIALEEAP